MLRIGIDLGGHTISAALAESDGCERRFAARTEIATPSSRSLRDVLVCLAKTAAGLACGAEVAAVGVGVPGFVEAGRRKIARLTNFHSLENIEFARLLEEELRASGCPAPVLLENDANCAALGEGLCGEAAGCGDFAVFTLGSGIGAGLVAGGRLLSGAHGMAGEAGHMSVANGCELCGCGGTGHMERAAAADWIEKAAVKAGLPGDFKILWQRRVEPPVAALLEPALDCLARGIASVTVVMDPELVILSGGMSRAEGLAAETQKRVLPYLPSPFRPAFKLKISKLGSDAALWGALSLAEEGAKH